MDPDKRLRAITDIEADRSRVLVTLLFTDLVGSTETVAELGDRRWRALLERHHDEVRRQLQRFDGHELDCAGDGFFAVFATATGAVRCGLALTRALWALGLEARVGLHTGECERFERKVSGVAVHAAARVVRLAEAREVLATETVKVVTAGSDLAFEERGVHTLRGLPGEWRLYAALEPAGHADDTHVPRLAARRRATGPGRRMHVVGPRGR
jgi:class 3 adenylate cyclase